MDSKTYTLGILILAAVVLLVAHFIPVQPAAMAATAVRERDYSLVTARTVAGGDALYVADNRTGIVAVFTWDPGRRSVILRDARPMTDAFTP